jgi:arylsulfatase A-like enzyme
MDRRTFLAMPLVAASCGSRSRPNILFVLVDDLRFDELGCTGHPFARTPHADRLAREGALFTNAFAVTPLCSPSRASFLTGQYPHRHGIVDNTDRSPASHGLETWPARLQQAGYETAFIGKWHMGNDDSPRPGFDHWVSFPGQGESIDPQLNIDGETVPQQGYITDVLTDQAIGFLERERDRPFCLWLAHKAIHPNIQQAADGSIQSFGTAEEFVVAERHRNLYAEETLPRRGNYRKPPRGKPALERSLPGVEPLSPATATDDATIRNRMRMTKAIDEGLGRMLAALEQAGVLDRTMVIFTSDHGYFYGEHCLNPERRLAYEEAIRIPLVVRYPPMFPAATRREEFFLSVDVAALCLEQKLPAPRDAFLIEYYSDTVFPRIRNMGYQAVRTKRWKYIHYLELEGADELYDLQEDPWELDNRIADPQAPLAEMKGWLDRLRDV